MARRQPDRFIGFFKLLDAMKLGGCPICRRIIEDTQHAMDSFLYESVNDPGIRLQIRRDGGLCHRHSWQLARFGDALGEAILLRDVLGSLIPQVNRSTALSLRKRSPAQAVTQPCFFCRGERRSCDSAVTELSQHIADPELKAGWDQTAMLCMPHLQDVRHRVSESRAQSTLVKTHIEKYRKLCDQLEALISRQSCNRNREPAGEEKHAWLDAIEALVGRAGAR